MFTLNLTLNKKWFDRILSGEKTEEYREIKDYWARRLLLADCEMEWAVWSEMIEDMQNPCLRHNDPKELMQFYEVKFQPFEAIRFTNGYGRNRPSFLARVDEIGIGSGRPEWGAEPGRYYFVFRLGPVLERSNISATPSPIT